VAGHHDSDSGAIWVNIELRKIVNDIDENPAELDQFRFRQRVGPCAPVVVAAYYRDRRNAREFINDRRAADITGVDDEITAAQEVNRLRSEKVMRIRNKADTNRTTQAPSNTRQVELSPGILTRILTTVRCGVVFPGSSAERPCGAAMCRNIKTLFNFEPPATEEEIKASSLQFVRKLSGFTLPSKANQVAYDRAVEQVAAAARQLIESLVTTADPRDRDIEAARAKAKSAARFG
jgi:hypothetical protein